MGLEWGSPDAVVLTAIANSAHPADLVRVIATADACNHDIMPEGVFVAAVGRLAGSGIVHVDAVPRFSLTKSGHDLVRRRSGGLIEQVGSVRVILSEVPVSAGAWSLPPGFYDEAVRAYLEPKPPWWRRTRRA